MDRKRKGRSGSLNNNSRHWSGELDSCAKSVDDAVIGWMKGDAPNQPDWPLPNVHLGVSVENKKHGLPRIEHLRKTAAAVRFVSVEPLLEDLGDVDLTGIHWVIFGCESGKDRRPMEAAWVESLISQCRAQNVLPFVKQMEVNGSVCGDVEVFPLELRVRERP